jgi:hypothetical protein
LWNDGLRLSPDYRTGYFARQFLDNRLSAVGGDDLFIARRPGPAAPFLDVVPLTAAGINTPDNEDSPTVSGDGLLLVFQRGVVERSGSIYFATRTTPKDPFTYQGLLLPSAADPFVRQDGRVLYLSQPLGSDPASPPGIYRATWNGSSLDPPVPVPELNSTYGDYSATITPDDLTIFFASERPHDGSPHPAGDVWTATRSSPQQPFSAPTNVAELNSEEKKQPNFITSDGCVLYLTTQHLLASGPNLQLVQSVAVRPRPF